MYCESYGFAIYQGSGFRVYCHLPPDHEGDHESADFTWTEDGGTAILK